MGVVHLGVDREGRQVAVKVLHPHVAADLKARDRLTREVETMRRVRSPRVAEVLDAELGSATPYIVTRFAPGRTLEQTVLEDGPLSAGGLVRLARGLCEALAAIHAANVIHRDFKPANVVLVSGEPLVIDFGIAHLVNATRLTQTGMFVGTPGYLAPEIIRDDQITQAADVHALAATVFFGATGKPPFGTGTFESVCYNILEGRAQLDAAPAWLRGWLRDAFAVDPALRPTAQTMLRMARALDPSASVLHEGPDPSTRVLTDVPPVPPSVSSPAPRSETRVLPADYGDLLPPVRYGEPERSPQATAPPAPYSRPDFAPPPPALPPQALPPQVPPPQAPPPAGGYPPAPYPDRRVAGYPPPREERERPAYRTRHPVIGLLLLTILVALACVLPIVVSAFAIVAVLVLRVGNHLLGDLIDRRSVRGNSASDALMAVLGTPWALIKATFATALITPLAVIFAACVWAALAYLGRFTVDTAAAYAAGAFTAALFVLPGGGAPRKAVKRTLTSVIRSPGAAMVVTITVGTLAFFAVMTALNSTASWLPWRPPSRVIDELVRQGHDTAVSLVTGLIGDLMSRFGMGFLTFWS